MFTDIAFRFSFNIKTLIFSHKYIAGALEIQNSVILFLIVGKLIFFYEMFTVNRIYVCQ